MDEMDRRIIGALQEDGTLTSAALAERVGSSQASCWRRVKSLEEVGIINRVVALVDPKLVGVNVTMLCDVRLKNHLPESSKQFRDFVNQRDEILECYSMSGEWDYTIRVLSRSVEDYERFLMKTLLMQPCVATASSRLALSTVKYTTKVPV